jgi:hypothetical protein
MLVFVATLNTFTATAAAVRAFGDSGDEVLWALLYGITVVSPWIFFLVVWRTGADFRAAIAPAMFGPLALQVASAIIKRPERRLGSTPDFFWGAAFSIALLVTAWLLQKFRLLR